MTLPFVFQSQAVPGNWLTDGKWLGSLCAYDVGPLTDTVLMAMLGGVTWQACLDRILVVRNSTTARVMSLAAAFGCLLLFVPVLLVGGAVGYVNATALALKNDFHSDMILPAAIFSLSPRVCVLILIDLPFMVLPTCTGMALDSIERSGLPFWDWALSWRPACPRWTRVCCD